MTSLSKIKRTVFCLFCGATDDQTAEYRDEITRDLKERGWRSVGGTASACPECAKDKDAFAAEFKRSYEKLYGEAFSWPKVKGGVS